MHAKKQEHLQSSSTTFVGPVGYSTNRPRYLKPSPDDRLFGCQMKDVLLPLVTAWSSGLYPLRMTNGADGAMRAVGRGLSSYVCGTCRCLCRSKAVSVSPELGAELLRYSGAPVSGVRRCQTNVNVRYPDARSEGFKCDVRILFDARARRPVACAEALVIRKLSFGLAFVPESLDVELEYHRPHHQ